MRNCIKRPKYEKTVIIINQLFLSDGEDADRSLQSCQSRVPELCFSIEFCNGR